MPEKDWEPIQRFRAPHSLWNEFGEMAKERKLSRSVMLRDYMKRAVAEWKGRRGRTGDTPNPQDHDGG